MAIVHFDSPISDDERRERIFRGEIFVYSPTKHGRALIEHARSMIEAAFAPRSPEHAQYDMQVEDFAALLGKLKPSFIHHPTSKALVRGIMDDVGADPNLTYFDVPKLRTSTSDEYLTTGISLAFPPHRDTWYAAPFCQINWWTPIYDITSDNGMSFHPYYWDRPIKNNSEIYNYYEWNKTRATAHLHVRGPNANRVAPAAQEPVDHIPDARYITAPGGLLLFSAAQLHATLPNRSGRTRFSIDFRTVHFDDVTARKGAPNIDSASTGTALRDFIRGTDHARLSEDVIRPFDTGNTGDGILVYQPDLSRPRSRHARAT